MNVHVETAEGRATICGDVIYDFNDQIVTPFHEISANEPQVTGNHGVSKREEKAAIKKLLRTARFLLPVHDKPAKIEHGQVVGRMDMAVPGAGRRRRCRRATGSRPERDARHDHARAVRPEFRRPDRRARRRSASSAPASPSPRGRSGTRSSSYLLFSDMPADVRRRWDRARRARGHAARRTRATA